VKFASWEVIGILEEAAMNGLTSSISVEEYLSSSFKPACEDIDGVLRQKSVPTKLHALIQFLLVTLLRRQGVEALAEVTVHVSSTKFLIPDVLADAKIEDPYPTRPVALCVEILSPEDRISAAFAKCEEYHAWGVPYCWVLDPVKRTAWEYHAHCDPVKVEQGGTLHADKLLVGMDELFSGHTS
jgi:Uma2 family endonuclease